MNIHKAVFGNIDLNNEKDVLNINIIKTIVGNLIIMQLDYVVE